MVSDHAPSLNESKTVEFATIQRKIGLEYTLPRSRSTSIYRNPQDIRNHRGWEPDILQNDVMSIAGVEPDDG